MRVDKAWGEGRGLALPAWFLLSQMYSIDNAGVVYPQGWGYDSLYIGREV